MGAVRAKHFIVSSLNRACCYVDEVAYRPAVVRLTSPLPRWWNCQLAEIAYRLDTRWETEIFGKWGPGPPCDICRRRASWLCMGGVPDEEGYGGEPYDPSKHPPDGDFFMARHPLQVCYWCRPGDSPIESEEELEASIPEARSRSVAWRWSRSA
jgi:hypothetical protein